MSVTPEVNGKVIMPTLEVKKVLRQPTPEVANKVAGIKNWRCTRQSHSRGSQQGRRIMPVPGGAQCHIQR
jgi:hypothetical protein